jgi:rubrerythrin
MEIEKKVSKLRSLCQLDIDAIGTYDAALARLDVPILREKLTEFRADHVRHVSALNEMLVKMGSQAVSEKPDLKGSVLKGFTSITSRLGNEAALMAMVGNEELTTRTYHSVLDWNWAADERELIERHYGDERRHLEWIKQAAKNRQQWASQREARAQP